jgi:hypothetical protein
MRSPGCSCSRTQGGGREAHDVRAPSASSTAAASSCRSWCCLCAPSVRTRCLFCEAAAEETPALAMADEKPKVSSRRPAAPHRADRWVARPGVRPKPAAGFPACPGPPTGPAAAQARRSAPFSSLALFLPPAPEEARRPPPPPGPRSARGAARGGQAALRGSPRARRPRAGSSAAPGACKESVGRAGSGAAAKAGVVRPGVSLSGLGPRRIGGVCSGNPEWGIPESVRLEAQGARGGGAALSAVRPETRTLAGTMWLVVVGGLGASRETRAQLENAPSEARATLGCGLGDQHQSRAGHSLAPTLFGGGHRMDESNPWT